MCWQWRVLTNHLVCTQAQRLEGLELQHWCKQLRCQNKGAQMRCMITVHPSWFGLQNLLLTAKHGFELLASCTQREPQKDALWNANTWDSVLEFLAAPKGVNGGLRTCLAARNFSIEVPLFILDFQKRKALNAIRRLRLMNSEWNFQSRLKISVLIEFLNQVPEQKNTQVFFLLGW